MSEDTNLPRYFFGDGVNQEPKKGNNDPFTKNNITGEDLHLSEPNLSRIPSPASSLTSNKKLEWDSGADIGYMAYNSIKTCRSHSFPNLNCDLSISNINKENESQNDQCPNQIRSCDRISSFQHSTPNDPKMFGRFFKNYEIKIENGQKDKCLQTTMVNLTSKSAQTDRLIDSYRSSIKSETESPKIMSSSTERSTATNHSKCSSFQFIPGSNFNSRSPSDKTGSDPKSQSSYKSSSGAKTDSSAKSSCSSPLAKIISRQQSKHLITDIDKSLSILHSFIKSNNYNSDTKKYYAKKIINKIVNNKYVDDSPYSSNSVSTTPSAIIAVDKVVEVAVESPKDKIDCAIQCDPAILKSAATSPMKNKHDKIKEKLERLTQHTLKYQYKNSPSLELNIKNWKEGETLSEKLFEARRKFTNSAESSNNNYNKKHDYLVEHSRTERRRQLSWINNEILYLHKLKDLLQNSYSTQTTDYGSKSMESDKTTSDTKNGISDLEKITEQPKCTSDNSNSDQKLSKYLTMNEIKYLLENDVKTIHTNTCSRCHKKIKARSPKTHSRKNKETRNYEIYENLITCCNVSGGDDASKKSDLEIQCTLHSKKVASVCSEEMKTEVVYDNLANFNRCSSRGSSIQNGDKEENHGTNRSHHKKHKKLEKPVAYYLTFEESSPTIESLPKEEKQSLESVVVKVPKFKRINSTNKKINNISNKNSSSLQDYLHINRPNFVKSANWRRDKITEQSQKRCRTIFTCAEMREMTLRKYCELPEVKEKIRQYKIQTEKTFHRCRATIFSKKLQRKTLQGQVSISTCRSVMSSN